jgi:hypothetical protein
MRRAMPEEPSEHVVGTTAASSGGVWSRLAEWGRAPISSDSARQLWVVFGVALLVRIVIVLVSRGSNDMNTWEGFADYVREHGLQRTYRMLRWFNHPPLMGLGAAGLIQIADTLSIRFDFLFKLPAILANVGTLFVVYRAWIDRGFSVSRIWLWLAVLNPIDLAVSAYHGNTDAECAFFLVLSAFLVERKRAFLGGLALALAINVKLIPVILIAPFLLGHRRGDFLRFGFGLALGALAFVPILILSPKHFVRNVIEYNSFVSQWGFGMIVVSTLRSHTDFSYEFREIYTLVGRYAILGASALLGVGQAWRTRLSTYDAGAICMAVFLVAAPGFGLQYLIYPVGLLLIAAPRLGMAYAYVGGVFAVLWYQQLWTGTWPAFSDFREFAKPHIFLLGIVAWGILAAYLVKAVPRAIDVFRRGKLAAGA